MRYDDAKMLFVGGDYNDEGGRPSRLAQRIYDTVRTERSTMVNGGTFEALGHVADDAATQDIVYWFANVPNDKPKLVQRLKARNPASLLITSKRNDGTYGLQDVLQHALRNKSNLVLEIERQDWGVGTPLYRGRVLDPLGNLYADHADFGTLGQALRHRADKLLAITRARSERAGERITAPDHAEFFELIHAYAERFGELVRGATRADTGPQRFVGNASFRCERGFPSFREGGRIYVSRRDIDKRSIGRDGFVAVEPTLPVRYYGDDKPSVDTPVQLGLYGRYPNINYMLHGHVYIAGAPSTLHVLPCGALEEIGEIARLLPDTEVRRAAVNLRGHGSIIMSEDIAGLRGIECFARVLPEPHHGYRAFIEEDGQSRKPRGNDAMPRRPIAAQTRQRTANA